MSLCSKKMTPLQRRSMQLMSATLMLTLLTNLTQPTLPNPLLDVFPGLKQALLNLGQHGGQTSMLVASVIAALSALPVLLAVWVAARYLKAEPDEFIRMLVVRALLWGFAITLAGNAVAGVFINVYGRPFPLAVFNADLFFMSTGFAFRLLQRSYR